MPPNDLQSFLQLASKIYDETDLKRAAKILSEHMVLELPANGAGVYLYNRLTGRHEAHASAGAEQFPVSFTEPDPAFISIPAFMGKFVCGYLLLNGVRTVYDIGIQSAAKLLVILYDRKFVTDMFENASRPIDYHQDEESFQSDLRTLTRVSSQMPAGALRVLDGEFLRTIFAWNDWEQESFEPRSWDIALRDAPKKMRSCVADSTPQVVDSSDILEDPFFRRPMQEGVSAAVFCPVIVGSRTIGVLSFALPIEYQFTAIEIKGFLNLSNSVGVALTNFNQGASAEIALHDEVRVSQILTSVEVAQAVRHSAKADLDTVKVHLATINLKLLNGGEKGRRDIPSLLNECDLAIGSCQKSLDDIKTAIRPPRKEIRLVSVKSLFERAKLQVRGKLVTNAVSANWIGQDVEIQCFPDHLLQVFLNLFINSVDAFGALSRKSGREIKCRLHAYHENADSVEVRFEDNAGGVDVSALRVASGEMDASVEELVFKKDVTTKGSNGSGWGLYVSKKIVTDHGGHMSLVEHRGGKAVFQLTLRKRFI